jgi:hypothetical protein
MADKFKEMASKAKQEHQTALAAAEENFAAREAERSQAVATAVSVLTAHVRPIVEQARASFQSEGVKMQVTEEYDLKAHSRQNPSIIIRCAGPVRPSDGYQTFSRACTFSSDGLRVFAAMEDHRSEKFLKLGDSPIDGADNLVEEGIKRVLQAYFDELSEMKMIAGLRH